MSIQNIFNKKILLVALFSSATILGGCGTEKQDITLDSAPATTEQLAETKGSPIFDPLTSNIPYPNDLLFAGSTDGTLNFTVKDANDISDPKNALNELDGFSTSAPISIGLSKAMDSTTVAAAVKVFKVTTDASTKAVTSITATLTYGVDYFATLSSDGKTLVILPLKPLAAKSSYMVAITNALKDTDGNAAISGATYAYLKLTTPLIDANNLSVVPGLPNSSAVSLEPVRQFTQAQLGYAVAMGGLSRDEIIMTSSFSTQSIDDVLDKAITGVTNSSLQLADTNLTTTAFGTGGSTKIYAGALTVPYFLEAPTTTNPTAPLIDKWKGQAGGILTQYSVALGDSPKKNADVTIPVLASVPTGTMPTSGWPVVIFQHGITQNRGNLIAVADALAAAGFVGIAIDMPLHGITSTSALAALRNTNTPERTFDLDFVTQDSNGSITAAQPDGVADSSGRHFIQLSSLLTTRDNLRQAVSDLVQLKAALGAATGLSLDANNVHFVGHSLGGMVGGVFANKSPDLKSATFVASGLQASYILANSASFGPEIDAGLAAKGIVKGSADYNSFLLAAQTVSDSGDPVNYVSGITVPTLLMEVVGDGNTGTDDQVIPNAVSTAPLAGTEPWASLQGLNAVKDTGAVGGSKGVIRFTAGTHGSLLDTTSSAVTTQTMQQAMASFAASAGTAISITSNSTVKQ
ncbi:alpha/beta fold hydrolase [Thiosulfativibrio zosterae]|uniref:Lipase n=1 Tax=Thiosulfativibrio zosterae TaxID=2675053 RepID=A0A6F8PJL3_9GAMM|nr:alpha/beta fold hydrolase [Thiosulfativibrio zosterae]BBP42285.1 hypothetical protein THMIRHAT_00310 [Thiosulfativibrio zosterae]